MKKFFKKSNLGIVISDIKFNEQSFVVCIVRPPNSPLLSLKATTSISGSYISGFKKGALKINKKFA